MKRRNVIWLWVMLSFIGTLLSFGQEEETTSISIPAVQDALKPAAEFLAHAYDLKAANSPVWRALDLDGDAPQQRELRRFFRAFAIEASSERFAEPEGGLYQLTNRYRNDPSLAVFGPPSASFVMANREFDTSAESAGQTLAAATYAWAIANTKVVEYNVKELLHGVAPMLAANPQSGRERVAAALAARRSELALVNRQTEACLAKYQRLAAEFEHGLYHWDVASPRALGTILHPLLVEALTASKARLGKSAADAERARRIDAAIQRIRGSGVQFALTSSTGANQPGAGIVTHRGSGGSADTGLLQRLVRTAYLYMAVWSGELAALLDVQSIDLRSSQAPIRRVNLDLVQQLADFQKEFREHIQLAPNTPVIEIRKLSWQKEKISPSGATRKISESFRASIGSGLPFSIHLHTDKTKGLTVDGQFQFSTEQGQAIVRYATDTGTRKSVFELGLFALQESIPIVDTLPVPDPDTVQAYRELLKQRETGAPILSPLLLFGDPRRRDPSPEDNSALVPLVWFASAERPVPGRNLRIVGRFREDSELKVIFRSRDGSNEIPVAVLPNKRSANSVVVKIPAIQGEVDLVITEDGRSSAPYSYGEILAPDSRPAAMRRLEEKQGRQILEFITQFAPIRSLGGILYAHTQKTGFFRYIVASKSNDHGKWVFVYDLTLKERYKNFTLEIYLAHLPRGGATDRFLAGDATVLRDFVPIARIERNPELGNKVYRATILEHVIAKGIGIDYDEETKKILLNNLGRIDLKKFGAALGWDSDREVLFHEQELGGKAKLKGEAREDRVTLSLEIKDEQVIDGYVYRSLFSVAAADDETDQGLTMFTGSILKEGSEEVLAEVDLVQSGPPGLEPGHPTETIKVAARISLGTPSVRRGMLNLMFEAKEGGASAGSIGWAYAEGDLSLGTSLRYTKPGDDPRADYQIGGSLMLQKKDILADVDIEASGRLDAALLHGDVAAIRGSVNLEAEFDFALDARLAVGFDFQRDFVESDETMYTLRVRGGVATPLAEIFLEASTTLGGGEEDDQRFAVGIELEGVLKSAFRLVRQEKEYTFPIR